MQQRTRDGSVVWPSHVQVGCLGLKCIVRTNTACESENPIASAATAQRIVIRRPREMRKTTPNLPKNQQARGRPGSWRDLRRGSRLVQKLDSWCRKLESRLRKRIFYTFSKFGIFDEGSCDAANSPGDTGTRNYLERWVLSASH